MSSNVCRVCTNQIEVMCRKGTGLCGEICEKREKKIQANNLETYTAEEVRTLHGFEILSYGPSLHGLGTIETVQDSSIERPAVPSLLGARAAQDLEDHGALLVGDIREGESGRYDRWDGSAWLEVEKPERKVG